MTANENIETTPEEEKLVIGITLKGSDVGRFLAVQKHLNLSQDANTVRVLIRKAYKEILNKKG